MIALADHASRLLGAISSPVLIAVTTAVVIAAAVAAIYRGVGDDITDRGPA